MTYHTHISQKLGISFQLSGILVKIFSLAELGWIDKDGCNDDIIIVPGLLYEREMTCRGIRNVREKVKQKND